MTRGDLISRKNLLKNLRRELRETQKDANEVGGECILWAEGLEFAIEIVKEERAADGLEVVRCKDCKHWWKENETCKHPKCCEAWMCVMQAPKDHFCSYGERITDV